MDWEPGLDKFSLLVTMIWGLGGPLTAPVEQNWLHGVCARSKFET